MHTRAPQTSEGGGVDGLVTRVWLGWFIGGGVVSVEVEMVATVRRVMVAEMVAPAVTVAATDVMVGPWCFDGGVGGDVVDRVTWVIKVTAVEMVAVAVVVDSGGVMGAMTGDGGGWQRWLLWMAAAAMVVSAAMMETSGGAWWRVMDLIDRDMRSHFGVCRKISPVKLSGGGGGGRLVVGGGCRK
nr:hypothetical protein [Tanacetum cinerariifolium]